MSGKLQWDGARQERCDKKGVGKAGKGGLLRATVKYCTFIVVREGGRRGGGGVPCTCSRAAEVYYSAAQVPLLMVRLLKYHVCITDAGSTDVLPH